MLSFIWRLSTCLFNAKTPSDAIDPNMDTTLSRNLARQLTVTQNGWFRTENPTRLPISGNLHTGKMYGLSSGNDEQSYWIAGP